MEHTNHPFRKENDLPNRPNPMIMFHVNLPGCIVLVSLKQINVKNDAIHDPSFGFPTT